MGEGGLNSGRGFTDLNPVRARRQYPVPEGLACDFSFLINIKITENSIE
jgi:hypothetical protein